MKGWYIPTGPDEADGESTFWYASFWSFCSDYLNDRFGDDWYLSAEQSLGFHAGDWSVPKQLLVRAPKGGNKPINLLYETSILDIRVPMPASAQLEMKNGMRIYKLSAALVAASPAFFSTQSTVVRAAMSAINASSEILEILLEGGHSTIASRLAGAFRNIGRGNIATNISETMKTAGYRINEVDPFENTAPIIFGPRETSPHVNRIRLDWIKMREDVLRNFSAVPRKEDSASYLNQITKIYRSDAYNSLSIEGYRVNAELIERVRSGNWNPDNVEEDRKNKNALAARGYWQTFQAVKQSIEKVLAGRNPGTVIDEDHHTWYRELFGPGVNAGLLKPADLAGYRNGPVLIRSSMHVPPGKDAVRDLMPAFLDLLANETEPSVRVVLGHFVFVYIHPYYDGNGRMGRFLMNLMLAGGSYPWTVIPVERRQDYMSALERASVAKDIVPFTRFLSELVEHSDR